MLCCWLHAGLVAACCACSLHVACSYMLREGCMHAYGAYAAPAVCIQTYCMLCPCAACSPGGRMLG